ncbi:MAG: hypothetical protein IT438_12320 [Phycisphaerales bacterium]|nr:hypothetical protein [Phycisphaerales bacterium]
MRSIPVVKPTASRGRMVPLLLMSAAAVLLVGFVAWSVGYSRGQDDGKKAMLPHTSAEDAAIITGNGTPAAPLPPVSGPTKTRTNTESISSSVPSLGMPPVTGPDPRNPGENYLTIVTLTWKDAQAAVRFLQKNGLPATCIPVGKVDPAAAQANNANHLVFVLDGIPSGQYKASESKRNDLIAKVRTLGKRWQREERGASDFGEPQWVLFRGK